jgi:hypothetical protein
MEYHATNSRNAELGFGLHRFVQRCPNGTDCFPSTQLLHESYSKQLRVGSKFDLQKKSNSLRP